MELCQGTLADYINWKYHGPKFQDQREILHQVTQGLVYLHQLRIVHGDIKPTNLFIFVPSDGSDKEFEPMMKIADFGISKCIYTPERKVRFGHSKVLNTNFTNTSETNPTGTKGWMAPEVYESNKLDFKVDIWGLGLIFGYTLSGGKHPYGNDVQSDMKIFMEMISVSSNQC